METENSDMGLSHEIKSFNLKNIRFVFLRTKKWFLITKKSDLFLRPKKKWFFDDRKIISFFLYVLKE